MPYSRAENWPKSENVMNQEELDELYLAALEADDAGEIDEALAMFRRGAQQGDVNAYNLIGFAYDAGRGVEQDKNKAIEWFKRAWSEDDGGMRAQMATNIALTYGEMGQLEEAESWWHQAIEAGDKSAHLGYAKFLMKLERAVPHAQVDALIRVAANASARMEVSEYEKEEAQRLLRDLRRHSLHNGPNRTVADRMLEAGGEAATAYFEDSLRVNASDEIAHLALVLLAIDRQDVPTALRHAREIKRLNPNERGLNLNFGRIYAVAGTYDKAIEHYKRALAIRPGDEFVCFSLGEIYYKRHQWSKAVFYLGKIRDFIEWKMIALNYLWRTYDNIGDIEKERATYYEMLQNNPYEELALQNLGVIHLYKKDYAQALELSEQAKLSDPNNPQIDRNIARAKRGLAGNAPK